MDPLTLERTTEFGRLSRTRRLFELLGVCTAALGGAYLTSLAAGRLGLPTSGELIFEGEWLSIGWDRFPWLDCVGMFLFMFALPVVWRRLRLRRIRPLGSYPTGRVLTVSAIGAAAVLLAYAVRHVRGAASEGLPPESVMILGSYWFIVALGEEVTFRGALQAGCESVAGILIALTVATVAFVFWHGLPASLSQLLFRSAAGIAFGLLYHASRSLIPPVLCHWLLNLALIA